MKVSVKEFDVAMDVKKKGIEFDVYEPGEEGNAPRRLASDHVRVGVAQRQEAHGPRKRGKSSSHG